jgi:hypothetical protein
MGPNAWAKSITVLYVWLWLRGARSVPFVAADWESAARSSGAACFIQDVGDD